MLCNDCFDSDLTREQRKINKIINNQLRMAKKQSRHELKLLLLGTGESGKSTFVKQMRIIHDSEYFDKERKDYTRYVYHNIIIAIQSLIKAMARFQIKYNTAQNEANAVLLNDIYVDYNSTHLTQLSPGLVSAIKQLWADSGVQKCYERRNEYQLSDSAEYYFNCIDRIAEQDYCPTREDILRVRIPTTGINEYTFEYSIVQFRIIDVGGQRSERRKWIHCFEKVTSIIFLAALNEYDQTLFETDQNQVENRMEESLKLFQIITGCNFFEKTSVILFLNKKDLFEEKIKRSNLVDYFPEYDGPLKDPMAAREFVLEMFLAENSYPKKQIFSHFTCATDTENIRIVFESVKQTILEKHMEDFMLA